MISLQQLQTAGHLVLREALVDKNLRVSPVSYASPPEPEGPSRSGFHFSERKIQTETGVVTRPPSQGVLDYSSGGQESGSALRARGVARGEDKKFSPHDPAPGAVLVGRQR